MTRLTRNSCQLCHDQYVGFELYAVVNKALSAALGSLTPIITIHDFRSRNSGQRPDPTTSDDRPAPNYRPFRASTSSLETISRIQPSLSRRVSIVLTRSTTRSMHMSSLKVTCSETDGSWGQSKISNGNRNRTFPHAVSSSRRGGTA